MPVSNGDIVLLLCDTKECIYKCLVVLQWYVCMRHKICVFMSVYLCYTGMFICDKNVCIYECLIVLQ